MATQVVLPQLGEAVIEGSITSWYKKEGEPIQELEPLVEVNTDKVDTEVPSPVSGTVLKIVAQPGETVPVGSLLAWIGDPGETIPADDSDEKSQPSAAPVSSTSKAAPVAPQSTARPVPAAPISTPPPAEITQPRPLKQFTPLRSGQHPQFGYISPVAAKIINQNRIDISQIRGSGSGGRITKNDLLSFLEKQPLSPAAPAPLPAAPLPTVRQGAFMPHTTMRRRIAEHMVMSKRTSPHVLTVMEADLSRVMAHRAAHKAEFAQQGVKLTFTPYFIAAATAALQAFPMTNSSWKEDGIQLHPQINIGMATDLGNEGLIVPVIKQADSLSLLGIARAVNDLAARARAHQLSPDDVQGGTFTITNHGVSGSLFAMPIINQPQCAIMGVGAIQKRPVVVTDASGADAIAIRAMTYLSLTFDHRILDGAAADHFLAKVVEALKNWT